jgi:hypothetical protein
MVTRSMLRDREDAFVWGAPLSVFPVLAYVPVAFCFFIHPAFAHARVVGLLISPLLAISEISGLARIASCFEREFDVISFLAAGIVIMFTVVAACAGVLLALVAIRA